MAGRGPHDLSLHPVTSEGEGHCPGFCCDIQPGHRGSGVTWVRGQVTAGAPKKVCSHDEDKQQGGGRWRYFAGFALRQQEGQRGVGAGVCFQASGTLLGLEWDSRPGARPGSPEPLGGSGALRQKPKCVSSPGARGVTQTRLPGCFQK